MVWGATEHPPDSKIGKVTMLGKEEIWGILVRGKEWVTIHHKNEIDTHYRLEKERNTCYKKINRENLNNIKGSSRVPHPKIRKNS